MRTSYYIPGGDREFNSWQDNWFKTLLPNAEAWNIPAVEVTQLTELKSAWEAAFLLADEPSTKTSVAVQNKNNARKEYQDAIRHVVNLYITYNGSITDGQRKAMGVTVHKTTRTPVPVPTSFPEVTLVDSNTTRRLTIHFVNSDDQSRGKPYGVQGAVVKWKVSDEPITAIRDFTNSLLDTRSPVTIEFADEASGKVVYFALSWQNTKGEMGPFGKIQSVIVQ